MKSSTDTRDLRDPQALGSWLLDQRMSPYRTVREKYDALRGNNIKKVSKDDSMGKQCVREYRAELEERSAAGDKYAASALAALNKGERIEVDEPV